MNDEPRQASSTSSADPFGAAERLFAALNEMPSKEQTIVAHDETTKVHAEADGGEDLQSLRKQLEQLKRENTYFSRLRTGCVQCRLPSPPM